MASNVQVAWEDELAEWYEEDENVYFEVYDDEDAEKVKRSTNRISHILLDKRLYLVQDHLGDFSIVSDYRRFKSFSTVPRLTNKQMEVVVDSLNLNKIRDFIGSNIPIGLIDMRTRYCIATLILCTVWDKCENVDMYWNIVKRHMESNRFKFIDGKISECFNSIFSDGRWERIINKIATGSDYIVNIAGSSDVSHSIDESVSRLDRFIFGKLDNDWINDIASKVGSSIKYYTDIYDYLPDDFKLNSDKVQRFIDEKRMRRSNNKNYRSLSEETKISLDKEECISIFLRPYSLKSGAVGYLMNLPSRSGYPEYNRTYEKTKLIMMIGEDLNKLKQDSVKQTVMSLMMSLMIDGTDESFFNVQLHLKGLLGEVYALENLGDKFKLESEKDSLKDILSEEEISEVQSKLKYTHFLNYRPDYIVRKTTGEIEIHEIGCSDSIYKESQIEKKWKKHITDLNSIGIMTVLKANVFSLNEIKEGSDEVINLLQLYRRVTRQMNKCLEPSFSRGMTKMVDSGLFYSGSSEKRELIDISEQERNDIVKHQIDKLEDDIVKRPVELTENLKQKLLNDPNEITRYEISNFKENFMNIIDELQNTSSKFEDRKLTDQVSLLKMGKENHEECNDLSEEPKYNKTFWSIFNSGDKFERFMKKKDEKAEGATSFDKFMRLRFYGENCQILNRHLNQIKIAYMKIHKVEVAEASDKNLLRSRKNNDYYEELSNGADISEILQRLPVKEDSQRKLCERISNLVKNIDYQIKDSYCIRDEHDLNVIMTLLYTEKELSEIDPETNFSETITDRIHKIIENEYSDSSDYKVRSKKGSTFKEEDIITRLEALHENLKMDDKGSDHELFMEKVILDNLLESGSNSEINGMIYFIKSMLMRIEGFRNLVLLSHISTSFLKLVNISGRTNMVINSRIKGTTLRLYMANHSKKDESFKCVLVSDDGKLFKVLRFNQKQANFWRLLPYFIFLRCSLSLNEMSQRCYNINKEDEDTVKSKFNVEVDLQMIKFKKVIRNYFNNEITELPPQPSNPFTVIIGEMTVGLLMHSCSKENNTLMSLNRFIIGSSMSSRGNYRGLVKKIDKCLTIDDTIIAICNIDGLVRSVRGKYQDYCIWNNCFRCSESGHHKISLMYQLHSYFKKGDTGADCRVNEAYTNVDVGFLRDMKKELDENGQLTCSIGNALNEYERFNLTRNIMTKEEAIALTHKLVDIRDRTTKTPYSEDIFIRMGAAMLKETLELDTVKNPAKFNKFNKNLVDISLPTNVVKQPKSEFKDKRQLIQSVLDERSKKLVNSINVNQRSKLKNIGGKNYSKAINIAEKTGDEKVIRVTKECLENVNVKNLSNCKKSFENSNILDIIEGNLTRDLVSTTVPKLKHHIMEQVKKEQKKDLLDLIQNHRQTDEKSLKEKCLDKHIILEDNIQESFALDELCESFLGDFSNICNLMNDHPNWNLKKEESQLIRKEERINNELKKTNGAQVYNILYKTINTDSGLYCSVKSKEKDSRGKTRTVLRQVQSGSVQFMKDVKELKLSAMELYICLRLMVRKNLTLVLYDDSDVNSVDQVSKALDKIIISGGKDVITRSWLIKLCGSLHDFEANVSKKLGYRYSNKDYSWTRSTSVETFGIIMDQFDTADTYSIARSLIIDKAFEYKFGTAPKVQFMGDRDLAVLEMETKIMMKFLESVGGSILKDIKTDLLENPARKQEFTNNWSSAYKSGKYHMYGISGDHTKWGPKHSYTNFYIFFRELLTDSPVKNLFLAGCSKGFTKKIEIKYNLIKRAVKRVMKVGGLNSLSNDECSKLLCTIMDTLEGSDVNSDWNNFQECFGESSFCRPFSSVDLKDKKDLLNWLIKEVQLSSGEQRSFFYACNRKLEGLMYAHMGQGIMHECSSVVGSSSMMMCSELFKMWVNKKYGDSGLVLEFCNSSDDYSCMICFPKSKFSEQEARELTGLFHDLKMLLASLMNMDESPKTIISPVMLELYSHFSIEGVDCCSTYKQLSVISSIGFNDPLSSQYNTLSAISSIVDSNGSNFDVFCFCACLHQLLKYRFDISDKIFNIMARSIATINPFVANNWRVDVSTSSSDVMAFNTYRFEKIMNLNKEYFTKLMESDNRDLIKMKNLILGFIASSVDMGDIGQEERNINKATVKIGLKSNLKSMKGSKLQKKKKEVGNYINKVKSKSEKDDFMMHLAATTLKSFDPKICAHGFRQKLETEDMLRSIAEGRDESGIKLLRSLRSKGLVLKPDSPLFGLLKDSERSTIDKFGNTCCSIIDVMEVLSIMFEEKDFSSLYDLFDRSRDYSKDFRDNIKQFIDQKSLNFIEQEMRPKRVEKIVELRNKGVSLIKHYSIVEGKVLSNKVEHILLIMFDSEYHRYYFGQLLNSSKVTEDIEMIVSACGNYRSLTEEEVLDYCQKALSIFKGDKIGSRKTYINWSNYYDKNLYGNKLLTTSMYNEFRGCYIDSSNGLAEYLLNEQEELTEEVNLAAKVIAHLNVSASKKEELFRRYLQKKTLRNGRNALESLCDLSTRRACKKDIELAAKMLHMNTKNVKSSEYPEVVRERDSDIETITIFTSDRFLKLYCGTGVLVSNIRNRNSLELFLVRLFQEITGELLMWDKELEVIKKFINNGVILKDFDTLYTDVKGVSFDQRGILQIKDYKKGSEFIVYITSTMDIQKGEVEEALITEKLVTSNRGLAIEKTVKLISSTLSNALLSLKYSLGDIDEDNKEAVRLILEKSKDRSFSYKSKSLGSRTTVSAYDIVRVLKVINIQDSEIRGKYFDSSIFLESMKSMSVSNEIKKSLDVGKVISSRDNRFKVIDGIVLSRMVNLIRDKDVDQDNLTLMSTIMRECDETAIAGNDSLESELISYLISTEGMNSQNLSMGSEYFKVCRKLFRKSGYNKKEIKDYKMSISGVKCYKEQDFNTRRNLGLGDLDSFMIMRDLQSDVINNLEYLPATASKLHKIFEINRTFTDDSGNIKFKSKHGSVYIDDLCLTDGVSKRLLWNYLMVKKGIQIRNMDANHKNKLKVFSSDNFESRLHGRESDMTVTTQSSSSLSSEENLSEKEMLRRRYKEITGRNIDSDSSKNSKSADKTDEEEDEDDEDFVYEYNEEDEKNMFGLLEETDF